MGQYKQTPKPDSLFFRKFKSYLTITAPIGLIPDFIRQDFHMDLLSWQQGVAEQHQRRVVARQGQKTKRRPAGRPALLT